MKKIYFTLDKRIPQTLHAKYKGRKSSVGISIVPKVMENPDTMLYEEQIKSAEDYLKTIIRFNNLDMKNWIIKLLGGYTLEEFKEKEKWLQVYARENRLLNNQLKGNIVNLYENPAEMEL